MKLTVADLSVLENSAETPANMRELVEAALDASEGFEVEITVSEEDASLIKRILNPHLFMAFLLMVGLLFGMTAQTAAIGYSNDCRGWAQMLGKEGRVRDSITMHYLGCDDKASPTHYHATFDYNRNDYCTKRARYYARWGYFGMPKTVGAMVEKDLPFCTVFEDGSYSAYG